MGHSMGGKATWRSTKAEYTGIKVAVSTNAHCVSDCRVPTVPTLMITGNLDSVAQQWEQRAVFRRMRVPGVFVGLAMAHGFNNEFAYLALEPLMVSMFRCHLLDDQEACSQINQRSEIEDTCFGWAVWTN